MSGGPALSCPASPPVGTALEVVELPPAAMACHTDLLQLAGAAGAGLVELQEAGDWQAPTMPAHYARHQLAARGAVAKLRSAAGPTSGAARRTFVEVISTRWSLARMSLTALKPELLADVTGS